MAEINKEFFNVEENFKQNKMEDILTEDEEILVRLNPNKKVYILEAIFKGLPLALIWGGLDAFVIVMMVSNGIFDNPYMIWFIIPFFALHLVPVWLYIAGIVKRVASYKNIEYALTNKRVIIRSGIIGIDFKTLYYSEIQSVNVKVGLFDRLFKVGDIYITSVYQSAVLDDVSAPYAYATKIQEVVMDIKTDIEFPNDLRPETNHGYRTKYHK